MSNAPFLDCLDAAPVGSSVVVEDRYFLKLNPLVWRGPGDGDYAAVEVAALYDLFMMEKEPSAAWWAFWKWVS